VNLLFSFEIFGLAFLPCSVAIDSPILQRSFWTLQHLKQSTYSSTVPFDVGPVDLRVEICEPSLNFSTLLGSRSRRELAAEESGTEREREREPALTRLPADGERVRAMRETGCRGELQKKKGRRSWDGGLSGMCCNRKPDWGRSASNSKYGRSLRRPTYRSCGPRQRLHASQFLALLNGFCFGHDLVPPFMFLVRPTAEMSAIWKPKPRVTGREAIVFHLHRLVFRFAWKTHRGPFRVLKFTTTC
jgi:hypothetical protein